MSNLLNRLKKAESVQFLSKKKHMVFVRQSPNAVSEEEKQFFKNTPNLKDYKILIITWDDPNADENIRRFQKQNEGWKAKQG